MTEDEIAIINEKLDYVKAQTDEIYFKLGDLEKNLETITSKVDDIKDIKNDVEDLIDIKRVINDIKKTVTSIYRENQ